MCALTYWEEPNLSLGVLKRTLSHIWLRLYLPMFWFKVGLFTLMNIDSLMVLACPQSSLPIMLKLLSVMAWPVHYVCPGMGEGCFRLNKGFSNDLPLGDPWGVLAILHCLLVWGAWGKVALAPWQLVLCVWEEVLAA